ncbi:hypothetical protein X975_06150, partial [Stegodyphus mimosarum]
MVDASDVAIGDASHSRRDNGFQPPTFFSWKLIPIDLKYSTYDTELLAIQLCKAFSTKS